MKSMCQEARRNSPSVAERSPTSSCTRTTSRIASSSIPRSSSSSMRPALWSSRACSSRGGRSRLPTWSARKGGRVRAAMGRSSLSLGVRPLSTRGERSRRGSERTESCRLAQDVGLVRRLPREVVVLAAEVAVGGGLLVDRPVQPQVLAERARAQVEVLVDQRLDPARGRPSRSRTSRPSPTPGARRRSRTRPGPRRGRPGPRRRRSSPRGAPRTPRCGRPSTGPCPRTRRRRDGAMPP